MRLRTKDSLSLFFSSAIAACSGVQDGLVTVGIRPVDAGAAMGGNTGVTGSPAPGRDEMNESPDGTSATTRGVIPIAASETFPRAGSDAAAGARSVETVTDAASAGAAGISAPDAGSSLAASDDECGAIPARPAGNVTSGVVSGSGLIGYDVSLPNVFTRLRTTLAVPAEPAPNGQIYVWSGIQPAQNGVSFQPIGNGALMSVLTWGALCPSDAPASYSTWWIAPMYSNISSSDPQYAGCHGGKVAQVEPKQLLDIDIQVDGTTWVQKVVNRDTSEASDFRLDLKGQEQGRVFFALDLQTSNKPTEDLIFTNTVLSMDRSEPDACQPVMRGSNDFAAKPRVSRDGKHCCIDRIVLRAPRVMATTMDPP
jgi:hypothetical protein